MYCEIYLDVIFLTNLVMDFVLLRLTCRALNGSVSVLRSLLGAAAGALGACVFLMIPVDAGRLLLTLCQGILAVGMAWIGCRPQTAGELARATATLYLTAFLCGGFWEVLSGKRDISLKTFFLCAGVTYLALTWAGRGYRAWRERTCHVCPVILKLGGQSLSLRGLYDTGNQLEDPVSGKPVSVVDRQSLEKLLGEELTEYMKYLPEISGEKKSTRLLGLKPHFLTYQGISRSGILLAVTIEDLFIHTPGEVIHIPCPVVAVPTGKSALGGDYQMIINAKLIRT